MSDEKGKEASKKPVVKKESFGENLQAQENLRKAAEIRPRTVIVKPKEKSD
ncbi:MAG: hypothetical protein GQ574_25635 [Crocinitomix sp.]|nr:hypothetical protein [Crocinitomix sp.]